MNVDEDEDSEDSASRISSNERIQLNKELEMSQNLKSPNVVKVKKGISEEKTLQIDAD